MPSGGDVREITWNNPVLGSGRLLFKSGCSSQYNLGGYRSEDADDGVDSGGNMIDTMTNTRWSFETDNVAWSMLESNRMELEAMVACAGVVETTDFTITSINGVVYAGNGKPVGNPIGDGKSSTFSIKLAGGGVLQKIS
ncbi:MAG: hypothetical protein KF744_09095 [Taibaiella sp.]|nr:hypothetical protein [Taibaiella sp.]